MYSLKELGSKTKTYWYCLSTSTSDLQCFKLHGNERRMIDTGISKKTSFSFCYIFKMFGFLRVLHSKGSENAIMTKNVLKNQYWYQQNSELHAAFKFVDANLQKWHLKMSAINVLELRVFRFDIFFRGFCSFWKSKNLFFCQYLSTTFVSYWNF